MTKKLEDLFDLASFDNETEGEIEVKTDIVAGAEQLRELDSTLEKIDAALPSVTDIASSDDELDHLAQLAEDSFKDLMELGMNVEPMRGSEIFTTASSMLGHAINAKNSKIDKKLKIVQLQIQKARLELKERELNNNDNDHIDGDSTLLDRNAILEAVLNKNKSD